MKSSSTPAHLAPPPAEAAGLDAHTIAFITSIDSGIRDGMLGETDGTLSRLIGRPTTPLVEGLRGVFQG